MAANYCKHCNKAYHIQPYDVLCRSLSCKSQFHVLLNWLFGGLKIKKLTEKWKGECNKNTTTNEFQFYSPIENNLFYQGRTECSNREEHFVPTWKNSLFLPIETICFNIKEQFVLLDETECSMPRNTLFSSTKQKSRNKIFSVTAFLILCLSKRLLFYLLQFQGFSCLKKSLPLSSTKMNAGKFSTSIFHKPATLSLEG